MKSTATKPTKAGIPILTRHPKHTNIIAGIKTAKLRTFKEESVVIRAK